jgi:Domain of unknown function (DUF4157)
MACGCAAKARALDRQAETSRDASTPRRRTDRSGGTGNQTHLRRLQAKLTVGAVNDPLEQEADAAADQVMRMADPQISQAAPPTLSRKCAQCEEEEKRDPLHRKEATADAGGMGGEAAPPIVDSVLASPGRALDPATHDFMASRFGTDFGNVRIHTGADAARSAAAVGARAYTVGQNVVFGSGQYDPAGNDGRRLLAHELAHVVQQRATGSAGSDVAIRRDVPRQSKTPTVVKRPRESFPWIGRIRGTYSAALRRTPGKDPNNPHAGTVADLPEGKFVDVLGNEKGWLHVRATVDGKEVEGYVSQELVEFNRSDAPPVAPVPAGPITKDILRLDQTVPVTGLVTNQSNYIDHFQGTLYSAPIGPDYTFVPRSGPASQNGVSIPKDSFFIDKDPLAGGTSFAPVADAVYKSRATAEAVVAAVTQQTPDIPVYTYYLQDGIIFPTTLSDTTIPNLMPHIRDKREADMQDIRASATLAQSVANAINPVPCTEVDADGSLTVNPTFLNCALPIILHAAPHVMGGKPGTSSGPGEAPKTSEPTSVDRGAGEATGNKPSEIADAVAKNEINAKQLAAEVAELRSDAGDPAKVHRPADPNSPYDAEMTASDGHEFHRDKDTQLWERCSPPCKKGLKLDAETNKKVDAAVQTKDKPVPPDEEKASPATRKAGAPMKGDAGQIQGVDQFRTGQTIAVAEIQHPDGTIEKVAACYEKAGWRPEQAERARELGYKPLEPSKKGSGMHAEEEIAAYAQKVGGKVVHGHWAISRGRGGTSVVCDACENLTWSWGPPQGGKD